MARRHPRIICLQSAAWRGVSPVLGDVAVDDAHPPVVTADVARALDAIEAGDQHPVTVQTVRQAVEDAAERAMGPGGGGLLQVVAVPAVLRALDAVEAPGSRRAAPVNPFGRYAGLRVNKARYDRARARRFKRSWAKWIPHLVVWDATLRMVAGAAAIPAKFKPGFVLDDDVLALTSRTSRGGVVYLHPDRFAQVLKAHAARPVAVAVYLHHLACHELTHLDSGRLHANGHDERWVSSREDLGVATGHLLPAIVALVERTLKVKGPPSADAAFLAAARNEVEQVRRALERERGKAKAVAGELRAANRELVGLREGIPTPGTRLRWRTLAEWLVGWREIRGRRISRQTYEAQAAHLAALADNAFVVEAAPAADVDRLEGVLAEHNVTPPHGKRAGHQVTRLRDAMAVARRRAGTTARRKVTAEELLERVVAAVAANPPAGVTEEDVRGFVARNWEGLVGEVRAGLP